MIGKSKNKDEEYKGYAGVCKSLFLLILSSGSYFVASRAGMDGARQIFAYFTCFGVLLLATDAVFYARVLRKKRNMR